jgi:hypothetical protein
MIPTLVLALLVPIQPQSSLKPTQLCAWIVETRDDDFQNFNLWLQADREIEFFYVIGGEGVVRSSGKSHSPSSGTYVLDPGKPEKPWGFGTNPGGPATVDIIVEIHQKPADIFSKAATPLFAKFTFRRTIPESEKTLRQSWPRNSALPLRLKNSRSS